MNGNEPSRYRNLVDNLVLAGCGFVLLLPPSLFGLLYWQIVGGLKDQAAATSGVTFTLNSIQIQLAAGEERSKFLAQKVEDLRAEQVTYTRSLEEIKARISSLERKK